MGSTKDEPAVGDGAAKEPTSKDAEEFRDAVSTGREMERTPDSDQRGINDLDNRIPGVKFLASLLTATIFTDLFAYQADLHFSHITKQERIQAMVERAPQFYKWCRNADFAVRGGLLIITVALVGFLGFAVVARLFIP